MTKNIKPADPNSSVSQSFETKAFLDGIVEVCKLHNLVIVPNSCAACYVFEVQEISEYGVGLVLRATDTTIPNKGGGVCDISDDN